MIFIKQGTIEEFAEAYNLTLVVNNYGPCARDCKAGHPPEVFIAHFTRCFYIKGPEYPLHTVGHGTTREEAIADYAKKISCNVLMLGDKRSLLVWKLT